jgi:outer membrane protein assembly factor BamB
MYTPGSSLFAVANGILYGFGIDYYTGQQNLYAVRETPGRPFLPVWMIPLDQFNDSCWADPLSRLTVDGGLVYLGCSSHSLYVIDAVTGVILDQTYIDYPFIVYKGNLYGSGQVEADTYVWGPTFFFELNHGQLGNCGPWGNIFCAAEGFASVDNGVALWNYSMNYGGEYIGSGLLAMNVGEGSLAWYHVGGFSEDRPEPVVANGVVYTVGDGYLSALNAKNGQGLWSLPGLGKPIVSLTVAKASAMGYAACGQDGQDLCAFTLATGKIMWTASGGGTPLAAANGVVYANGAFDAKTGKWLGAVSGVPANGMVYVTDGGSIAAYGPRR